MKLNKRRKDSDLKFGNLVTYSNSDSIIADQFRTIRTNIKFLKGKRKNRIFLITSPVKGEEKSMITANLAVSMAQQKEKILLIDANLREPIIHRIFDTKNDIGLTDILTNKATFKDVIYETGIRKLDILTSGRTLFNPAELLGNDIMSDLLDTVVNDYNVVLIDSPTVLKSTETRVLANQCDGVVLVIKRRKTKLDNIVESRKTLELAHANLVGAIITEG